MTLEISDARFFHFSTVPHVPNSGEFAYNIQIELHVDDADDPPAAPGTGMLALLRQCCSIPEPVVQHCIQTRFITWYDIASKTRQSLPISGYQVFRDKCTYQVSARDRNILLIFKAITDENAVSAYALQMPKEEKN